MDYERLYNKFVKHWKNQSIPKGIYTEEHHIIPKHCGGQDDEDNIVKVTYRQHIFAHKLLYKAFERWQDKLAYTLMESVPEDRKKIICSAAGKVGGTRNRESGHMSEVGKKYGPLHGARMVESGHLDRIRPLANNEIQRQKAKELGRSNVETGRIKIALEAAWKKRREGGPTEKQQKALSEHNEKMRICPKAKENMRVAQKQSVKSRVQAAEERANWFVKNAERNEEFLEIKPRGKYWYVSPEGLQFGTSVAAANYYGNNLKDYDVQNWCKRCFAGWKREPVIRK